MHEILNVLHKHLHWFRVFDIPCWLCISKYCLSTPPAERCTSGGCVSVYPSAYVCVLCVCVRLIAFFSENCRRGESLTKKAQKIQNTLFRMNM